MEAPKGVHINAEAGNLEATCRTELKLESKDGEVSGNKDHSCVITMLLVSYKALLFQVVVIDCIVSLDTLNIKIG